ncbi:MAG: NADH-quinone oxidoreductase subunit G [Nocardioidaceae bacterium]|nr:NADH-quinone oxidoreductase subunit G [Nocardioidaceae bacterium]
MTQEIVKSDLVTLTIDGIEVSVPAGTLVIRAAEEIGIQIPRFCDHPLLDPVGACRQCLVDIPDAGNGRGFPKPQASCTLPVAEGMVVNTQATSPVADKAQQGVMEFLLINHPLDCPVCDKGGECPLQNQAMSNGRGETRFEEAKRVFPKPINLSPQILLDRERCIVCQRCTRFADEVAGDPFIALVERGAQQQIGIAEGAEFLSYFSGNTIQICPVGALTSAAYRFRSRPFDLVSTPSITEHDASGSAIRIDHRRGKVMRRLAGNDPEVNEEWITDKDRFGFAWSRQDDRLTHPLVRDEESGELRAASWPEAFAVAARGLKKAKRKVGLLPGGRLTAEDAYAWSKFARVTVRTNNIDFRSRPLGADNGAEEAAFLASTVALTAPGHGGVTYGDLEAARTVVLAGLEPEDEAGAIFLRLRKAHRAHRTRVFAIGSHTTRGLRKMGGTLLPTRPGDEARALAAVAENGEVALDGGGVILVGERLATVPGALSAAVRLAATTGAKLAWVPRRAGDRGAVETGLLPTLLPGGRPVADAGARVDLAAAWGVESVPDSEGLDAAGIVAALEAGDLEALVVGGVDPADLAIGKKALKKTLKKAFVVALEVRESVFTEHADVVLPVAPPVEKSGSFVSWEGRVRSFEKVLDVPNALPDVRVLAGIAEERGRPIGVRTPEQAAAEMAQVGPWEGARPAAPDVPAEPAPAGLVLSSWKQLVDDGRLQDGDDFYRATARPPVLLVGQATFDSLGVEEGAIVTLTGPLGSATLPVYVGDLAEGTVWAPASSRAVSVRHLVGPAGSTVTIEGGVR